MTIANEMLSDPWLTPLELADYWKLKPQTLSNWRCAESGPPYTRLAGGAIRYRASDILEYEQARHNGLSWSLLEQAIDTIRPDGPVGLSERQKRDLKKYLKARMWKDRG